jgi:hypothetical protein
LGTVAATISSVLVLLILTLVDVAKRFGLGPNVPPSVFSLIGAAAVWAVLYFVFNHYVWRWPWVSRALRAPHVAGTYTVSGETLNSEGKVQHSWSGELAITQRWDRIRVRLKTPTSTSYSIAAALFFDPEDGYRLMYHYRNEPAAGSGGLYAHRGYADVVFGSDLKEAAGEYFNGQGRFTYGRMIIIKV